MMARLLGLSTEQVDGIHPLFPKVTWWEAGGRQDGVERHPPCRSEGARRVDAPAVHGPQKTLYNDCRRW